MREKCTTIDILSPNKKLKLDINLDETISQLRVRVAQELQVDPDQLSLVSCGKLAPADGALPDFLPDGVRQVFAVCRSRQPQKTPTQPTPATTTTTTMTELTPLPGPAAEPSAPSVLDLLPDHVLEDLESGGTRFADLVSSWEKRMRNDPVGTRRQLRSPQTRQFFDSLWLPPRSQRGPPLPIPEKDVNSLLTQPQDLKFIQEALARQREMETRGGSHFGILRNIEFHKRLLEESLKPLLRPDAPAPEVKAGDGSAAEAPPSECGNPRSVESPPSECGNPRSVESPPSECGDPRVAEAFERASRDLQFLRDNAPHLLIKLLSSYRTNEIAPQIVPDLQDLPNFMEHMTADLGGLASAGSHTDTEADTRRYSVQLAHLVDMGFTSEESNLKALRATRGNLVAAIEKLSQDG